METTNAERKAAVMKAHELKAMILPIEEYLANVQRAVSKKEKNSNSRLTKKMAKLRYVSAQLRFLLNQTKKIREA